MLFYILLRVLHCLKGELAVILSVSSSRFSAKRLTRLETEDYDSTLMRLIA